MLKEINDTQRTNKRTNVTEVRLDRSMLMNDCDRRKALNQSMLQSNLIDCEQFADKAIELILYNKINAKNAFDVNVEYLETLPNLLNKNEESAWQKASASLDASAKIYGYRVDSVHSETFKFLGGLSRADNKEDNNDEGGDGEKKEKRDRGKHDGYLTLEKDHKKLDLARYDLEFEVDPLFKSMTARFSEAGARGLLLNNLPVDSDLDVLLESKAEKALRQNQSHSTGDLSSEILSTIESTLASFTINDLKSLQVCPDLSYFKKSRELETSLERTFYNNLMNEFDDTLENLMNDGSVASGDSLNNSIAFVDNIDNDNMSSADSRKSSFHGSASPRFEDNMNLINLVSEMPNLNGMSYVDGFSYIKSEDIKEYIHQFGAGNKEMFKNLPHFKNFTASFNQLEKISGKSNVNLVKGENVKKPKKEEKLFEFKINEEVDKKEIFEKERKIKKEKINNREPKLKKKKVKQYYHYDRSILFNLFSQQDKIIFDNTNKSIMNQSEQKIEADYEDGDIGADMPEFEENKDQRMDTFVKIDNDYEKKFGRLYKTFDVRYVKSKIWESLSNLTKVKPHEDSDIIEFKDIMDTVSHSLSRDVISNISTPTCFVCLLHLSNEKNLILESVDENNFNVRVDDFGVTI